MNLIFSKKFLFITLIVSLSLKILISFYFGDEYLVDEWEILIENLIKFNKLSYYNINGESIPSAFMPPLYIFFLYPFFLTGLDEVILVKIILIVQSVISITSVIIFFNICKIFFNKRISIILTYIFLFYPLNFYSSTQISSITLQLFLFCSFIFLLFEFNKNKNFIFFGIISGLMMLIRGEFYILFFICLIMFISRKFNITKILLSSLICILIVSPYLFRNYSIFNEIIITKSSGYNLWRGNNIYSDVNGKVDIHTDKNGITHNEELYPNLNFDKQLIVNKLIAHQELNKYEIILDNYYKNRALNNIKENPKKYFKLYIEKFFSYLLFNYNSNYAKYFELPSIVPEILVSILFVIGFFVNLFSKQKNIYLLTLISFYLLIIPIFFILPRYKLFILPLMIIYIGYFLHFIISKGFFQNNNKVE